MSSSIKIRGARQHNLKNLDLDIQTGELTVVTGPSGSGKSSLVFDTLYAEGQRRYVETFSAYARQFLDRMDKPAVDKIEGVPPAIAIDQTNPVRSSRSTVGTMTELNDHLKLLWARVGQLFDQKTAYPVKHDTAQTIYAQLLAKAQELNNPRLALSFPVHLPANTSQQQMQDWLSASGYTRTLGQRTITIANPDFIQDASGKASAKKSKANVSETLEQIVVDVIADRFRLINTDQSRVLDAIEQCLLRGNGRIDVHLLPESTSTENTASSEPGPAVVWRYSKGLHCPDSDLHYTEPSGSMFSFNSAVGACPACRGFGRVIGVDFNLVIPNDKLTLRAGAIKPIQTPAWKECQDDLMRFSEQAGIPRDTPYYQLTQEQKDWVIEGSPNWNGKWNQQWYGVKRFFEYLETKSYKMHIRVLLSKYRSYTPCPTCNGARLQPESLLWRVGSKEDADAVLHPSARFMPKGVTWTRHQLEALPGLCLHDVMQLPIEKVQVFCNRLYSSMQQPQSTDVAISPLDSAEKKAQKQILDEIRTRLYYLCDVGIGYLSLDRQSRTLSGGEVQRINLTTALGTSLVNTLFVLDEPSIGLHPKDMHRITEAMLRLRDAGNTLVVVEHDPQVMIAADRVIDMGPGPGAQGGSIVFDGSVEQLRHADTLTGHYLGGRKTIPNGLKRLVQENTPRLILTGARENNLKNLTIEFPLHRMVCITGVSGSGKSTLMQDVLAPALLRHFGKPTESAGLHDELLGTDYLSDVVFVDQSPIGKSARSNPVSYIGAWDHVRNLFAQTELAHSRGYTSGKFSFNGGDGRCPICGGSGFEHVEMQFLSDIYLRCQECDGKRYRPEILEVTITRKGQTLNVADVLDLTVAQALDLFQQDRELVKALKPVVDVGLDYVKLGQPVPTLSGGEAQRLKLAAYLVEAAKSQSASKQKLAQKGMLFLFDEPTTGLHFDDIAKLMRSLRQLIDAGHSVFLIEHNLDVMRASDWIIDLGPDGGEAGGQLVAQGYPEELARHTQSHTAQALRDYEETLGLGNLGLAESTAVWQENRQQLKLNQEKAKNHISIVNAQEHNLKGLSVNIPRGQFNVVTGVSGSGKSTLAFDILFNEGQRRYLESLNAYARSIVQPAGRPEVDAVYGIPPTVAIEQRLSRGGRKSTVGTTTEVWHFLRLLYVKLGIQHCIHDDSPVQAQSPEIILNHLMRHYKGQEVGLLAPLVISRKGIYTELAEWARPKGYSHLRVDGQFVSTQNFPKLDRFKEHSIELPVLSLTVEAAQEALLRQGIEQALVHGKGVMMVLSQLDGLAHALENGLSTLGVGRLETYSSKRACPVCSTSYAELDPRMFSYNSKQGWCPDCVGTGLALTKDQRKILDDTLPNEDNKGREQSFMEPELEDAPTGSCPTCSGSRLNPTSRAVRFGSIKGEKLGIADIAAKSIDELIDWVKSVQAPDALNTRDFEIARDLIAEIASRLEFLQQVGLGYLTLDRGAPTLSGGEAQRIRLAAQLGSNLQGVCYVLDEPTIGLHARDNQILLKALHSLSDKGNTLVVVEHDEDTIRHADHIIDIGPGAGIRGGNLVAQGSLQDVMNEANSLTGRYLRDAMKHPLNPRRNMDAKPPSDDVVAPTPSEVKKASKSKAKAKVLAASDELARAGAVVAPAARSIELINVNLHNLQQLNASIPLKRLVAITGVSGSGKSTLAREVLLSNVQNLVQQASTKAGRDAMLAGNGPALEFVEQITGYESVDKVLEVDQTPIGKTPRSCPATYIGFWDVIRKLFADTLEAKARGYSASRFSFNTGEGRCPSCEGQGMRTIGMSFLPDVKVVCETCKGARFNPETLAVTWRGKNIGQVLQMEVDEAVDFFATMPAIAYSLQLLKDVGLGYLTLGQASPTLSGGEAQRLKLVTELSKVRDDITRRGQKTPHTLYVLDEPTVGLHMADVAKLITVLHRLVDAGHSVVVIEHDLDVIAEADWIIDLGPEGGKNGGQIVATGSPEQVVQSQSPTGKALSAILYR